MKRLLLLTFLLLTIGLGGMYVWGLDGVAFTDTFNQLIPFFIDTRRAFLTTDGFPTWSWNAFLGDNFFALYGYYTLANPFSWIICAFPPGYLGWGMILALYIKVGLCSVFTFLYLRELGFKESLCIAGGILYTFSSFFIVGLVYYFFVEPMMLFPLLLLCVEKVVRSNQLKDYVWLSLVTFFVVAINYYFAVSNLGLALIYFFVRLFTTPNISRLSILTKTAGAVILGILMAAVVLLPIALATIGNPRLEGTVKASSIVLFFCYLDRVFYLFFPRITDHHYYFFSHISWQSTAAYVSGCSFIGAFVWCLKKPKHWVSIWLFLLAFIYFTPLASIFTLFTNQTYMRWSYGMVLAIITATLKCSTSIKDAYLSKTWVCLVAAGMIMVLLSQPLLEVHYGAAISTLEWSEVVFCFSALVCAFICYHYRYTAKVLMITGCLCIIANFLLFDYFSHRTDFAPKNPERLDFREFMRSIFDGTAKEIFEGDFEYRTDYEAFCVNQGLIEDRPSILAYFSQSSIVTRDFREVVTGAPNSHFVYLVGDRYSLASLLSVKSFRDYRESGGGGGCRRDYSRKTDSVRIAHGWEHEMPHFIPMGMAYDRFIPKSEYQKQLLATWKGVDHWERYFLKDTIDETLPMLANIIVEDQDTLRLGKWLTRGHIDLAADFDSVVDARRALTAKSFRGTRRGFTAEFDAPQEAFYFLSVPADPGFSVCLDGTPISPFKVNLGMMGFPIPAGKHTLTATYTPPGLPTGAWISTFTFLIWLGLLCIACRNRKSI